MCVCVCVCVRQPAQTLRDKKGRAKKETILGRASGVAACMTAGGLRLICVCVCTHRFTRPYTSTELNPKNETEYTFANSTTWPTDPVSVPLNVRD